MTPFPSNSFVVHPQWPPGFEDSNPPFAIERIVPTGEQEAFDPEDLIFVQLPPVSNLVVELAALALGAGPAGAAVKPEAGAAVSSGAATPAVVAEDADVDMGGDNSGHLLGNMKAGEIGKVCALPFAPHAHRCPCFYMRSCSLCSCDWRMQFVTRASGKKQLIINGVTYDVNQGIPVTHAVQFVAIDATAHEMAIIGQASHRMLVQTNVDAALAAK